MDQCSLNLKEVCDEVIARSNAYRSHYPNQEKAHRLRKRRMAVKIYLGGFLWLMVIIVLPLVIDFAYPKMVPLLCWLNLSIICEPVEWHHMRPR